MTTRRNIVRDIEGNRYLLTSRRLVQLDSEDAKEGTPWYATNQDIRTVASQLSADGTDHILVRSRTSKDNATIVRVLVPIGKTGDVTASSPGHITSAADTSRSQRTCVSCGTLG